MTRLTALFTLAALLLSSSVSIADDQQESPDDLFDSLDANADGTLDPTEIGESQQRAFSRLLRVGDANDDGKLTRDEYLKGLRPDAPVQLDPPGRGPGGERGRPQPVDVGRLFETADRDGDGKIAIEDLPEPMQERLMPLFERLGKDEVTREDFEQFRRMQGGQPGQRQDVGRLFEMADRDGDGKVALRDLPEPMQDRMRPLFERLGKDQLTREDFERVRGISGGRPGAEGERPQMALVRVLDEDGNGQLSKTELEQLAAKFSELDRNGDGQLGAGELMGFAGGTMARGDGRRPQSRGDGESSRTQRPRRPDGTEGPPQQNGEQGRDLRQLLSQSDKDGDGALSREEAPERFASRFDRIDANGDGKLTTDELQRALSRRNRDSEAQ